MDTGSYIALTVVTLIVLGPVRTTRADVHVENAVPCIPEASARARLLEVLASHAATDVLTVSAVSTAAQERIAVTLRVVTPLGDVVLERRLDLRGVDCPGTPGLLGEILDTFLREFPRSEWDIPEEKPDPLAPTPQPVVIRQGVAWFGSILYVSVDSRWTPPNADLELGITLDVGSSRHRFTGSAALRLGLPQDVGTGHFIDASALLGLGWRYSGDTWLVRAEMRTGGIMVAGYGLATNRTAWLPWLELQGSFMGRLGEILLGPVVGISPLQHAVVTSSGSAAQIPWFRVGLMIALPIWDQEV